MKYQALFYSKDTIKKLKCRLLQFLFGALDQKQLAVKLEKKRKKKLSFFFLFLFQLDSKVTPAQNNQLQKSIPQCHFDNTGRAHVDFTVTYATMVTIKDSSPRL